MQLERASFRRALQHGVFAEEPTLCARVVGFAASEARQEAESLVEGLAAEAGDGRRCAKFLRASPGILCASFGNVLIAQDALHLGAEDDEILQLEEELLQLEMATTLADNKHHGEFKSRLLHTLSMCCLASFRKRPP